LFSCFPRRFAFPVCVPEEGYDDDDGDGVNVFDKSSRRRIHSLLRKERKNRVLFIYFLLSKEERNGGACTNFLKVSITKSKQSENALNPKRVRLGVLNLKRRRHPRTARTLNSRPRERTDLCITPRTRELSANIAAIAVFDAPHPAQRRDKHGRTFPNKTLRRRRVRLLPARLPTKRIHSTPVLVR
jgi:hypothetical protein